MTVQRNSQAVDFQTQSNTSGPDVQIAGVGRQNPGNTAFDFGQRTPVDQSGGQSWQLDLLKTLVGEVRPYVPGIAASLNRNEYLKGQAAAVAKQSEDELEANPITGDWQIAGHRDMQNRLRMADAKTQFELDLPALAAQGPQVMQDYLDKRRETLLPNIMSGSGQVADSLTGQLALEEQAAMFKHGDARRAWIVNNEVGSVGTIMKITFDNLNIARDKAMVGDYTQDTYAKQVQVAAGDLVGSIWNNERLDRGTKLKLTNEAMQYALDNNQTGLYDYIANNPIPLPDGTMAPLMAHMPVDALSKLSNKRREVWERTSAFRNMEDTQAKALMESQIQQGTFEGDYNDLTGSLQRMMANGTIREGEYGSILQAWHGMNAKNGAKWQGAQAFINGDQSALYKMGLSPEEGLSALESTFVAKDGRPGVGIKEQLPQLLAAGKNGMAPAYTAVGKRLGPAIMQLTRADGKINEDNRDYVNGVFTHLDTLDASAQGTAMAHVLKGMPDAMQDKVLTIRSAMGTGGLAFEQAVAMADKVEADNAKLTNSQKAARAGQKAGDIDKLIAGYEPMGLFSRGWNALKSVVSSDAAVKGQLMPGTSPWSDDQRVAEMAGQARIEIAKEAHALSLINPGMASADLVSKAAANVAGRTITTSQGALHLPAGMDKQKFFGTDKLKNISDEELSRAVDSVIRPKSEGGRSDFRVANGKLSYQEYDVNGAPTNNFGNVDPASVQHFVSEERRQKFVGQEKVSGAGNTVQQDGSAVTYSGRNTAAVPDKWAYKFRDNLVKNEGVKDKPYQDLSGKIGPDGKPIQTVGVGVSSHNPHYPPIGPDGKVSKADIDNSFAKASDDAMQAARRITSAIGREHNEPAFLLMSELAYQSGINFSGSKGYRPFMDALRFGTKTAAVDAFRSTPAYKMSGASRQAHYMNLINQI